MFLSAFVCVYLPVSLFICVWDKQINNRYLVVTAWPMKEMVKFWTKSWIAFWIENNYYSEAYLGGDWRSMSAF